MSSNAEVAQPYVGKTIKAITTLSEEDDSIILTFTDGSILEIKPLYYCNGYPDLEFGAMILADNHVIKL